MEILQIKIKAAKQMMGSNNKMYKDATNPTSLLHHKSRKTSYL